MRLAHWAVNAPFRPLLLAVLTSSFILPAQAADLVTIARDALQNDATLAAARAQLLAAEAGTDVERGALLPQVNTDASVSNTRIYSRQLFNFGGNSIGASSFGTDNNYSSTRLNLDASQALFDATSSARLNRARRQLDQQTLSLEVTRQQLLFDVSEAYFEILRAYDILEARRAQEAAIGRQFEQARERFNVGLIAITEVHEAEASFDLARAQRIAAESAMQVNFEALEQLTGRRYASIEGLAGELLIDVPKLRERGAWVALAMDNSPQVLLADAGVEVAHSEVELSRAERLPLLEAFANYQYFESDQDQLIGNDSNSQLGLRASMPLYTGGTTSAQIRQSTYSLEASQYDFEAQRRDTTQQVRSLYTQVVNDVTTVAARRQAIVSNRSALEATRSGYEVGTRNIVDVLNAEQSLYNAIANYAEARYDYVVNLLSLRQQAGLLDVEAIEEVNAWLTGEDIHFILPESNEPDAYQRAMDIGAPPTPGA